MSLDNISAWLVWILPLVASCFVPLVARKSDKARNYFVIAIAVITAALALSMVPGVFFGNGQPIGSTISWIAGSQPNSPRIDAGVYIDPLSVLFTCLVAFFGLIIAVYSWGYMKGEKD